ARPPPARGPSPPPPAAARGGPAPADKPAEAGAGVMARDEFTVRVTLGQGNASQTVWTTDLSYDYVRINAEYRT
ncbi:MAG: bifunctional ornithine acetyltransferase/N-acetylglutamate synthase, partial [Gammaproteobacteria bacterium]|nr:bifunctional ornithine acetyltransferase/N-acetylglutamate synthase [Gammaproteobacteria bacterium]